ncbi:extensin-like [Rosa chinensis]|uniref:extensin-like n=1 Tax=Rosa chinensis TaxID=74649 RepID=UPI000D093C25|nr:extensin-like [Rosa chinensis]
MPPKKPALPPASPQAAHKKRVVKLHHEPTFLEPHKPPPMHRPTPRPTSPLHCPDSPKPTPPLDLELTVPAQKTTTTPRDAAQNLSSTTLPKPRVKHFLSRSQPRALKYPSAASTVTTRRCCWPQPDKELFGGVVALSRL